MQHVLRMLETRDSVPVSELSETFAVSEVTVRSDLTALARQGLVARVRGGVRALQQGQSEVGFDLRLRLEVDRKRAIAKRAATMIGESEAVAIDASTTGYYLALELRARRELVVINNGLLGARGLSIERGLMDLNPEEVRIKQEMADACEQVWGIIDGTKWHRSALLSFVSMDDLTGII